MNPLAIMLIMGLLNYLSIELATANSLPTGFLWYNDNMVMSLMTLLLS
ncbi:putative conjugative transfer TraF domain protein [Orientia tsutsugamushi str. TA763]|nr:putative conjugative transfer TraF domain protein [Orientia tsutsugamushi str. TA763]